MQYWLKPIFITLAVFIVVALLVEALPATFPEVNWSGINNPVIAITPWLIVFGIGLFTLIVVIGRRK